MISKRVYFVRHAESEGNANSNYSLDTASLSGRGLSQADMVAARFVSLPIDLIVSSTMTRAIETAQVIATRLSLSVHLSNLFVERRRPTLQMGKSKGDNGSMAIESQIVDNFGKLGFRYSDEENFEDLKCRAGFALKYLEQTSEKNIVVVSHGLFLRIIVAYATFGPNLTGEECRGFVAAFHTHNTGVTVMSYESEAIPPYWSLQTWNDYSHLNNQSTVI